MDQTVKINKLTFLAFYLNGALGSGKYNDVSIQEVKNSISDGTIFRFLEAKLGNDIDLSITELSERAELVEEWSSFVDNIDEARKMCVDKNGICLLVAYLLEGIQQRVKQ